MKIPIYTSPMKRLTMRANQMYWKTYWNWYWNIRHNAFYANMAKYPMALTVLVCGFRYTLGDGMAQWSTQGHLQSKRCLTFLAFGCFSGVYAHGMYSKFYPMVMRRFRWTPTTCIIFENTFSCPAIYYTAFYITQGFIETGSFNFNKAYTVANNNRVDDLKSLWAFWGPMHFISFKYIQPSMRGVFAAAVGTAWVFILSMMRGDSHGSYEELSETEVQAPETDSTFGVPVVTFPTTPGAVVPAMHLKTTLTTAI